jgi:hypothetical protein
LMLTFTGDGAGVTTDAFAVVDQKSKCRHLIRFVFACSDQFF